MITETEERYETFQDDEWERSMYAPIDDLPPLPQDMPTFEPEIDREYGHQQLAKARRTLRLQATREAASTQVNETRRKEAS